MYLRRGARNEDWGVIYQRKSVTYLLWDFEQSVREFGKGLQDVECLRQDMKDKNNRLKWWKMFKSMGLHKQNDTPERAGCSQ